MKIRSVPGYLAIILILYLLPSPVLADNCSGLSDCFNGNMLPAILLILGLLLFIGLIWYFGGWAAIGIGLRGLLGWAARSRVVGALARFGRGASRFLGKWRNTPRTNPTRGLEKQLQKHLEKLANYRKNPFKYDNKDFLKNAPNDQIRQKIIDGRIRHLENEIKAFRDAIERIRGGP
jgi:hypothetical protein